MKPLYWLLIAAAVVYFVLLKPKKTTVTAARSGASGASPIGEGIGKIVDGAVSLFKTPPAVGGVSPGQSPSTEFSIEELETAGIGGI